MKHSTILILDASTPTLFLGLIQQHVPRGHHLEELDRKHAEFMLPRIISFLHKFNLKLADVTDVIVGYGPGSFTGVRLALTLIKTLALVQPMNVFPISTLQMFAHESEVIMSVDARGGRRYLGVYRGREILVAPTIVFETALPTLQSQFPQAKVLTIEAACTRPDRILLHLKHLFPSLSPLKDIHTLNPLYLKELV